MNFELPSFNEVPAEEHLHWRSFLVKLIVYTVLGDVSIYVVGKDETSQEAQILMSLLKHWETINIRPMRTVFSMNTILR
ncbi:hypothetical protein K7X08_013398 [Anisodus acutangulus]|uniref:Uncharacterized protein n=1 Tax=Anisodus acutangulus TaxID=402998 RepID=A0A9Q1MB49_9SOLA|nr:hypothetical protein K7X08_013398 [Anisodus acutangulus]